MLKKQRFLSLLAGVLTGGVLLAETPPETPPPLVGVGEVALLRDVGSRRYTGQVVSRSVIHVVPRVSGEILEVGFLDGAAVRKGQMLYRLDAVQYEAAVKSAEAHLAESKARLAYAQSNFERVNLLLDKNAASRDGMESAKAVFEAANASLLAAEAGLITARDNLSRTTITAPANGVAGVTALTAGNYVTPESGRLVTLVQMQPIRVRFAMSSADFLSLFGSAEELKRDAVVGIQLADGTLYPETGSVELLNNEVNARTDSLLIYATFGNKDARLMSGGTVSVTLSRKEGREALAVAASAVMHDAGGSYVFVVAADHTVEKRYIEAGNITRTHQFIRSGLRAGESVIVKGVHKAEPGAKINPRG